MIVVHFSMHEKIILSILTTSAMWLHSSMHEENIIEYKCHPFTLMINLLTIVVPRHRPHIILSILTPSVKRLPLMVKLLNTNVT